MAEQEQTKAPEENEEETYIKLSELKLKALEREYQETISADNKLTQSQDNDFQLNGKFEQDQFNNIQFINNNADQQQQQEEDNQDNDFDKDGYQQIQEDDEDQNNQLSDNDNWGEFQDTKDQNIQQQKEEIQSKDEKKLDVDLIKSIMAKIDIKPPEWAQNQQEWNQKLQQMFGVKPK